MRILNTCMVSTLFALVWVEAPLWAYNPAAHAYIAESVFPECMDRTDLIYGSIAPDIAWFVANPLRWPTAGADTHIEFIDLDPNPWSYAQKAFALGWWTHNEVSGADFFAHLEFPQGVEPGYVEQKAKELMDMGVSAKLTQPLAHNAIETAIDYLLKSRDPFLGEKLLEAVVLRSWQDRSLLAQVFVWQERRTDWTTLVMTESTFRQTVFQYASALALPSPYDQLGLIQLGRQIAQELYGIQLSPGEARLIFEIAAQICGPDYAQALDHVIDQTRGHTPLLFLNTR